MSTSYYGLKEPITSIRIESNRQHDRITIWVHHGNAGTLTVNHGDGVLIVEMLIDYEKGVLMYSYWGGDKGTIVEEKQSNLFAEQILISEYGEVLTVAKIRGRQGVKRKDGYPTELFGYED